VTDPVILAAALLHDTLEDTQTTVQELQGEFGERVAAIVMEVTDEPTIAWRARKKTPDLESETGFDRGEASKACRQNLQSAQHDIEPAQRLDG